VNLAISSLTMSLLLRSLLRDPKVTRPLSRAVRRFDDDWLDEWPSKRIRRSAPGYDSPIALVDDMNRQMVAAVQRMQEFAEDLEALDSVFDRVDKPSRSQAVRRRRDDAVLRRTEEGSLQLALDVAEYRPEDLKIKLVDDNLIIEAISESSGKDSYRRNQFKRWFKLPEDCKVDEIRSRLTEDHKLLIDLPTSEPLEDKARTIPIEMANQTEGKDQQSSTGNQESNTAK